MTAELASTVTRALLATQDEGARVRLLSDAVGAVPEPSRMLFVGRVIGQMLGTIDYLDANDQAVHALEVLGTRHEFDRLVGLLEVET